MKRRYFLPLCILFVSPSGWAQDELGRETWRFEIANDLFFDSDNAFTNGLSVQKHSAVVEDTNDLPNGGALASRLLPDRDGLFYRKGWAIGQNMLSPDDLLEPNIILDDVPYIGMLAGSKGSSKK